MKFKKEGSDEMVSILGEGLEMVGELSFNHGVRVDGGIKGKLKSESTLTIGPLGKVQAEAIVKRISISGEFRGSIRASERVEIHKDGKVYGDIISPCLIIEAGAIFEGKCNMSEGKSVKDEEGDYPKAVDTRGPQVSGENK